MRSTNSASWTPSTRMRLARATRARCPATAIEPDEVTAALGDGTVTVRGRTSDTARPSTSKAPGVGRKTRSSPVVPLTTTPSRSIRTSRPVKPLARCLTATPAAAVTSG